MTVVLENIKEIEEIPSSEELLLNHFSEIFDRAEKVSKLRAIILELGVRGKLVEQNENNESALELLEKIENKKKQLVKEKKLKKEVFFSINKEEELFSLPTNWAWSKIGNIITLKGGKRVPKGSKLSDHNTGFAYIRVADMKNSTVRLNGLKYIEKEIYEDIKNYIITKDDLYITIAGTIGAVGTIPEELDGMNLTENAARIIPYLVDKKWLMYFIKSEFVQTMLLDKVNQMAQPKLALKRIQETLIPVPPLEEQKKIVGKIEMLMTFCDKLEAYLEKKQEYKKLSAKSVFNSIALVSNSEELEKTLKFIIENFKELSMGKNAIEELRNCILQLAMQGKLVEQDLHNESGSTLLEKIKREKEALIQMKKLKKMKNIDLNSSIKFQVPSSWSIANLGELAENIHYGYTASAIYEKTETKLVRITDIQDNKVEWNNVPYCEIEKEKIKTYELKNKDILIARTGGTIGKSFLVNNISESAVFASYLIRVITMKGMNPEYIKIFLETPEYWIQLRKMSQGTGQPNVNATSLSSLVIPIPPYNEQTLIVKRVKELFELCTNLEEKIDRMKVLNKKVQESIIANIIGFEKKERRNCIEKVLINYI